MKRLTSLAFAAAMALSASAAHADVLATYDLFNASGSTSGGATTAPGFTVSPLAAVGVGGSAFSNHFYFNNWDSALNPTKYLSLSISNPNLYSLSQMTFSVESTAGAPSSVFVRSSLDGFASNVDFFNWNSPSTDVTNGDFDLSGLGILSGLLELRFYFTATSTSTTVGFANHEMPGAGGGLPDVGRDIVLNGANEVPEPSVLALLGIGALGAFAARRRRS